MYFCTKSKIVMKILPVDKIREADEYTIHNEPIASIDLMERAATNLYNTIKTGLAKGQVIHIFAGIGNNGGDGLVLARLLHDDGFEVKTWIVQYYDQFSPDFQTNLERLKEKNSITFIKSELELPAVKADELIIDAIFGSGLNRPVSGFTAKLIDSLNQSGAVIIAVDMPSGLFANQAVDPKKHAIIKADYTYSFEFPKLAFLMPENDLFVGRWEVLPIGLHPDFIDQVEVKTGLSKQFTSAACSKTGPSFRTRAAMATPC